MKLTLKAPPSRRLRSPLDDLSPRGRLLALIGAQTHRLLVALDTVKVEGTPAALDAAEKALYAVTTILDHLPRGKEDG